MEQRFEKSPRCAKCGRLIHEMPVLDRMYLHLSCWIDLQLKGRDVFRPQPPEPKPKG